MRASDLSEPVVRLPVDASMNRCRALFEEGERWVRLGDALLADTDLSQADPSPRPPETVAADTPLGPALLAMRGRSVLAIEGDSPDARSLLTERSVLKHCYHLIPEDALVRPRGVVTISATATRAEVLANMDRSGIRHLVLVESDGRWLGVLSLRDVALASPKVEIAAEMIRGHASYWVAPGTPLRKAAQRMVERGIGCLPIVEGNDVKGILTRRDLIEQLSNHVDGA